MIDILLTNSPLVPTEPLDEVLPPPFMLWWQWAILIITLLFVTLIIILLSKQFKKRSANKIYENPLEVAEAKISTLLKNSPSRREFPVQLSVVFREYIFNRYKGKSLFQTNEEINASHLRDLKISAKLKQESLDFLNDLNRVKYAQKPPSIANTEVANSLKMLLIQLDKEYFNSQGKSQSEVSKFHEESI